MTARTSASRDMQAALMATGLQQYWRRLNEMGYTRLGHVLRLGRGDKLEELLEQLKPMPGHRVRLLNFIEEERARAQAVAGSGPPKPPALIPVSSLKGGRSSSTVPRKLYKATPRPASARSAASTKSSHTCHIGNVTLSWVACIWTCDMIYI